MVFLIGLQSSNVKFGSCSVLSGNSYIKIESVGEGPKSAKVLSAKGDRGWGMEGTV